MAAKSTYPFEPKSAISLRSGEFWGVPLRDGSFGCGRVLQPAAGYPGASRVTFYGALLNWHGQQHPTEQAISGCKCIAQGKMHIKSLKNFGSPILGWRPLDIEEISPAIVLSGLGDPSGMVMRGIEPIRVRTKADADLPSQSFWGIGYIMALAEHRFLSGEVTS
jgi:hypothetical protein